MFWKLHVSVFTYKIGHESTRVSLLDPAVFNLCAANVSPIFKIHVPITGSFNRI
jgi:hypothetical protein